MPSKVKKTQHPFYPIYIYIYIYILLFFFGQGLMCNNSLTFFLHIFIMLTSCCKV